MLLCGWSPPAGASALSLIETSGEFVVMYKLLPRPSGLAAMFPVGRLLSATSLEARIECECDGISDSSSVTVSEPPVSPRSWSDSPGP